MKISSFPALWATYWKRWSPLWATTSLEQSVSVISLFASQRRSQTCTTNLHDKIPKPRDKPSRDTSPRTRETWSTPPPPGDGEPAPGRTRKTCRPRSGNVILSNISVLSLSSPAVENYPPERLSADISPPPLPGAPSRRSPRCSGRPQLGRDNPGRAGGQPRLEGGQE